MNFIKKQSIGFYLATLSIIIAIAGLAFYVVNCNTNYFKNNGVNTWVVLCLIAAIILEAAVIIISQKGEKKSYLDIGMIAAPTLLMVAFAMFIILRVNSIAAILSFERNAETMSDLSSALIGMGCCLFAVIFSIATSFFNIVKENR